MSLRILQLCSAREFVGEAARVLDLYEVQRQRGHTVRLGARMRYALAEAASRRAQPTVEMQFRSRFNPVHDLGDILRIRRQVREIDAQIVHAHRGKDHWLAAMALAGMRSPPPLIRTRHVVTPLKTHAANRWLFGSATDAVICVSEAVRDALAASERIVRGQVRTISGGTDLRRIRPGNPEASRDVRKRLAIPDDAPVVACLARLAPVKGQKHILRAMPAVLDAHPSAILILAYPRQSGYRDRLEGIVGELHIRHAVRYVGYIEELYAFLGAIDVGVLASIGSEGWSRVAIEYMAASRPVVATAVGALPEIVRDGETGFLVPPRNPHALAQPILRLLADPGLRARLGKAGHDRVHGHYSHERVCEEVLAFYHELLDRRR